MDSQPRLRAWGAAVLLIVTAAHTAACVALLRAGIAGLLGGRRPTPRLFGLAGALTAAGLAAGVAAFPADGRVVPGTFHLGFPARGGAAVAGVAQVATGNPGRLLWAVNYLLYVGAAAFLYRSGVWFLRVMWELDRGRDVQARLTVASAIAKTRPATGWRRCARRRPRVGCRGDLRRYPARVNAMPVQLTAPEPVEQVRGYIVTGTDMRAAIAAERHDLAAVLRHRV